MTNEAQMSGALAQGASAIAQGAAAYKNSQKDALGGNSAVAPSSGTLPGVARSFSDPDLSLGTSTAPKPQFGFDSWLNTPALPTGMVQQPAAQSNQTQPNQIQTPNDQWRERIY